MQKPARPLGSLQCTLNTGVRRPTNRPLLRGYYQQEIPRDPVEQGNACWVHTGRAAPPCPALPAWKNKVLGPGTCTQAKADLGPAGRGRVLICGLITARLDYQGWRSCDQLPVREHLLGSTSGFWKLCSKQSLPGQSAAGLPSCPGTRRELPQPFPHHSPHPPDSPPTPFCSPGFNFVPETFTASKSTIRAPSPILSSERVGVLKNAFSPSPNSQLPSFWNPASE